MTYRISLSALAAVLLSACAAWSADWITAPSYYTHDPMTGERVDQYSPIGPFYTYSSPDFMRSGYRHYRSSIEAGGSADNMHIVEEWGRPVRPMANGDFRIVPIRSPIPPGDHRSPVGEMVPIIRMRRMRCPLRFPAKRAGPTMLSSPHPTTKADTCKIPAGHRRHGGRCRVTIVITAAVTSGNTTGTTGAKERHRMDFHSPLSPQGRGSGEGHRRHRSDS